MEVAKSIHVQASPERAFTTFVDRIQEWWPLQEGFSFGGDNAESIFIEPHYGGRFYERFKDGDEFVVGTVSVYDPPNRLVFSWRSPDWDGPTEVEVRFAPHADGTLVSLEHRGWDTAGAQPEAEGYAGGWELILGRYAAVADG